MKEQASEILALNGLKKTSNRLQVLEILLSNSEAMSHSEINAQLNPVLDRVSLYRVLQAFEKKHIVHQFNDLQGKQRFAVCSSKCTTHSHQDEHAHLLCQNCKKTYCIEWEFDIKNLPEQFQISKVEINVEGICKNCRN